MRFRAIARAMSQRLMDQVMECHLWRSGWRKLWYRAVGSPGSAHPRVSTLPSSGRHCTAWASLCLPPVRGATKQTEGSAVAGPSRKRVTFPKWVGTQRFNTVPSRSVTERTSVIAPAPAVAIPLLASRLLASRLLANRLLANRLLASRLLANRLLASLSLASRVSGQLVASQPIASQPIASQPCLSRNA